jgi:hypothetical protein
MQNTRAAVATLELVMSLPILLVMTVCLVWLGYSLIGQARVNVEARHLAWQQRFQPATDTAFDFTAGDQETQSATESISVTPLLSSESGPESEQSIERGTWDHRAVELRSVPNWQVHADVSMAAENAGIQGLVADLTGQFQGLEQIGSSALQNALAEFAADLLNPSDRFDLDSRNSQQRTDLDSELEKSRLRAEINELENAVDQVQRELDELNSDDEPNQDLVWLLEKRLERLELQLELARSLSNSL